MLLRRSAIALALVAATACQPGVYDVTVTGPDGATGSGKITVTAPTTSATATPTPPSAPPPTTTAPVDHAPRNLTATLSPDNSVSLDWDDVPGATYNLYSVAGGSTPNTTGLVSSASRRGPFLPPFDYTWWVTSVVDGVESSQSNRATVSAPRPNPAPPGPAGQVTWQSDFEGPSPWGWRYKHTSGEIVTVTSPAREGSRAGQFTATAAGSENARAQLDGPNLFGEGDDVYIGWSTYFPTDYPLFPSWHVFFQFHHPPFGESPPLAFGTPDGDAAIKFARNAKYGYDRPWSVPLVRGRWHDFVVRVKWSRDPAIGFVELWFNGGRQTFVGGQQRIMMSTITDRQTGAVFPIATHYYAARSVSGTTTVYHDAVRVGTTYESARPR